MSLDEIIFMDVSVDYRSNCASFFGDRWSVRLVGGVFILRCMVLFV